MRPRGGSGGSFGGVNRSAVSVVVVGVGGDTRVLDWESELAREVKSDEEEDADSIGG